MRLRNWFYEEENTDGAGSSGGDTSFVADTSSNTAEPADGSTESDVNWESVADGLLADDASEVEGDLEIVGEGSAEVVPPVETPAAPAPVAPPATTPTPAPDGIDSQPITPIATPADTNAAAPQDYQAWRTGRIGELETVYALNEDDASAMLTEPEVVIPKLAARLHMEVLENSMRAVQAMIPQMMAEVNRGNELETRGKALFNSINPDLADPQMTPAILKFGKVYRDVNPTASPEEASRAIGNLVRAAMGIASPGVAPQAPPAAIFTPPAPFTPARGGGGGVVRTGGSDNFYSTLAAEFLADD